MRFYKSSIPYLLFILLGLGSLGLSGYVISEQSGPLFRTGDGQIYFLSDAPLEMIEARSDQLRGIINPEKGTFAFSVPVQTFAGFNSPLQREHFNENYMETHKFPNATFQGRIIEDIDFSKEGDFMVRAKGKLTIHGVEQERIIKGNLSITGDRIEVKAAFSVPLSDHDIKIPKIVFQKIAEEIQVEILLTMIVSDA